MAEFCEECFRKLEGPAINGKSYTLILDRHDDFCEGCGKMRPTVADIVYGVHYPKPFTLRALLKRVFFWIK